MVCFSVFKLSVLFVILISVFKRHIDINKTIEINISTVEPLNYKKHNRKQQHKHEHINYNIKTNINRSKQQITETDKQNIKNKMKN